MALDADARQFKKRITRIGKEGEKRILERQSEIDALPTGSWVCIDIMTGEYVVGSSTGQASDIFKDTYGDRECYLHGVGVSCSHVSS
ncbi:MAG: hypothetical protein WBK28_03910 [Minisyncoccia bacterium]